MANLDGADLTMILALRPGPGGDPETSVLTAGLVVTFDPGPAVTDKLLRAAGGRVGVGRGALGTL